MAKKSAPASAPAPELPAPAPETPPAGPPPAPPAESPGPQAEPVSAEELNVGLTMPAPSERAIAAIASDSAGPGAAPASPVPAPAPSAPGDPRPGELDSWNRPFDPAKYFPRKDSLGRWTVRRKTAQTRPGPAVPAGPATPPPSVVGEPGAGSIVGGPDRFDRAADMYCRIFYSLADAAVAGGGEWYPENDAEHENLKSAAAAYLRFKNSDDLPPGLALALAFGMYAAPRIGKPRTQARIAAAVNFLRGRKPEGDALAVARPPEKAPDTPSAPTVGESGAGSAIMLFGGAS